MLLFALWVSRTGRPGREVEMPSVFIALEEGFSRDTVVIAVNGKQVFHKTDVTTRLQIGLAESLEVDVSEEPATVEVSLPVRQASESIRLEAAQATHLGVSLSAEGRILFRTSTEPFGYV